MQVIPSFLVYYMSIDAEINTSLLLMRENTNSTKPDNVLSTSNIDIIIRKPGKSNNGFK